TPPAPPPAPPPAAKSGGYYLDDGPEANPPPNLDVIPDAVPRAEPLHRFANRTYTVLGNTYTPKTERRTHREEGLASWYGRRFHGKKTASGERYDMYAMTAAHPTLPIPSYVRVTALNNGKSVVVRINDRGPFHSSRVIDLSYTAAHKLGYLGKGHARVRVESIDPDAKENQGEASIDGLYLQVGAFSQPENAQKLLERIKRELELDDARIQVVLTGSLHRVQIGPYVSEDAARADRAQMRERLDLKAVLIRRERREQS
ncbi:MAG: septal ring lytic transglycosylase RlpA family protein, partial [Thiobacillus sp.]|nr:septal ring lytic transglycosylase RlpA family protein [Thiobacillus sp.]